MTSWNEDLKDMYADMANETPKEKEYREWIESLSDDEYLDHVIGKLNPPE